MSLIVYTALRSLTNNHVANRVYTIEIDATEALRSESVEKTSVRSLGGAMETNRNYADVEWQITFEPVAGARLSLLREFLKSTDSGEPFAMDIYGNSSSTRTLRRTDSGHSETPYMRIGSESRDFFTASITAIEA